MLLSHQPFLLTAGRIYLIFSYSKIQRQYKTADRDAVLRNQIQIKMHIPNAVEGDWSWSCWFSSPINDLNFECHWHVSQEFSNILGKPFFCDGDPEFLLNWLEVVIYLSQRLLYVSLCFSFIYYIICWAGNPEFGKL